MNARAVRIAISMPTMRDVHVVQVLKWTSEEPNRGDTGAVEADLKSAFLEPLGCVEIKSDRDPCT